LNNINNKKNATPEAMGNLSIARHCDGNLVGVSTCGQAGSIFSWSTGSSAVETNS